LRVGLARVTLDSVTLVWNALAEKTYRVQYKNDLDAVTWNDLAGDVAADGSIASKLDKTLDAARQRFYRIVVVN
jgi:hypothetical protein